MSGRRVVFLDRDGTINVDRGYVHRIEDFQILPGTAAAINGLQSAGFAVAIVSNQSGIGRGMFSEADFWTLHKHLQRELAASGATIDAVALCPHAPESACPCRKPLTSLADQIAKVLGRIDFSRSWTIGDKITDVEFGRTLGTKTALIRSQYWTEARLERVPDLIGDDLQQLAGRIAEISQSG